LALAEDSETTVSMLEMIGRVVQHTELSLTHNSASGRKINSNG